MRNLNRERADQIRAAMRASNVWERAASLGEKALYMNWAIQLLIDHAAQTKGRPVNHVEASRLEVPRGCCLVGLPGSGGRTGAAGKPAGVRAGERDRSRMKHVTSVTSALVAAVAVAGLSTAMAGPATKPAFRSAAAAVGL
jgi:hypothetical protein